MLAGLFAAAMSTIDSGINGVASVVVYDWLGGKELSLQASRGADRRPGRPGDRGALWLRPLLGDNVIDIIMTDRRHAARRLDGRVPAGHVCAAQPTRPAS